MFIWIHNFFSNGHHFSCFYLYDMSVYQHFHKLLSLNLLIILLYFQGAYLTALSLLCFCIFSIFKLNSTVIKISRVKSTPPNIEETRATLRCRVYTTNNSFLCLMFLVFLLTFESKLTALEQCINVILSNYFVLNFLKKEFNGISIHKVQFIRLVIIFM